jgi:hypothetical protein
MLYYPASELKKVTPRPRSVDQCGQRGAVPENLDSIARVYEDWLTSAVDLV